MTGMPVRADGVIRGDGADQPWLRRDSMMLAAIVGFALLLRCLFFTGFFGSDEVTYVEAAARIVRGDWSGSNYIGAIRYGVNLPIALFFSLFGFSEFSGNLWSLVTSLGEVALVYVLARKMWGERAAVAAALCLASLPVHAHYATRLMADAPLALFISMFFAAAWLGERGASRGAYVLAGIALGATFWIKDAGFYLSIIVLGVYVVLGHSWHRPWILTAAAALSMVAFNCALMWILYGNPMHLYMVGANSLQGMAPAATSPSFYLHYLLLDVKHTFLLGFLALGAIVVGLKREGIAHIARRPVGFVVIWGGVFVAILSMLSLRQVNYMLIFAAPLALLAGYFLSSLPRILRVLLLLLMVFGGIALTALEQQSVHAFTANSRSAVQFADAHPSAAVFGSEGASRADTYRVTMDPHPLQRPAIRALKELDTVVAKQDGAAVPALGAREVLAIVDPQVDSWAVEAGQARNRAASSCLMKTETLKSGALGTGRLVVDAMLAFAAKLPAKVSDPVTRKLESSFKPRPATVYTVGAPCRTPQSGVPAP